MCLTVKVCELLGHFGIVTNMLQTCMSVILNVLLNGKSTFYKLWMDEYVCDVYIKCSRIFSSSR